MKKMYYSIREVAEKTGIEPHVLRFWEKEFSMLRPRRRSGNRFYRERDIQVVLAIKELRHNEKYTIQGAVERLKEDPAIWKNQVLDTEQTAEPEAKARANPHNGDNTLNDLREMLLELRTLISGRS
ncbi:MAG: MerR family transcriptional regulator [bacterium]|nr:MerR family transcriptional regulator [bacterium]